MGGRVGDGWEGGGWVGGWGMGGRVGDGWEGGRVGDGWEATKWRAKATSSLKPAKWHPLVLFSPPHITQGS